MKQVIYYEADDGRRFNDRWECIEYERRKVLEEHKDEFQFFNYHKKPIPIEEATTENVMYIVVKSENCAKAIGDWFNSDECVDPFDGLYCECVGTWVYGSILNEGSDEWLKLELEIEKLQTLIDEINR